MKWVYMIETFLGKYCVARGMQPKTIGTYMEVLEEFRLFAITKKFGNPEEVTTAQLCDYIEHLKVVRENGLSTVNKKVTVLRSFYKALVSLELVEPRKDPCSRLPPMRRPHEVAGDILSVEEMELLTNTPCKTTIMGLRDRAILLLLCTTGIRASECAGIRDRDVDLVTRRIRVLGKGGRERVVMLNAVAAKAIENYFSRRGEVGKTSPVFIVRTGQGIDRKRIFDRLKYYLKKARIFKRISPHRLRHSFASKMIKDGVGLATLRELLGHKHIQSTIRYVAVCGEELRKAIESLKIDDTFERIVSLLPAGRLRFQKPNTGSI
jgi:integrase/recombinase XerD